MNAFRCYLWPCVQVLLYVPRVCINIRYIFLYMYCATVRPCINRYQVRVYISHQSIRVRVGSHPLTQSSIDSFMVCKPPKNSKLTTPSRSLVLFTTGIFYECMRMTLAYVAREPSRSILWIVFFSSSCHRTA